MFDNTEFWCGSCGNAQMVLTGFVVLFCLDLIERCLHFELKFNRKLKVVVALDHYEQVMRNLD